MIFRFYFGILSVILPYTFLSSMLKCWYFLMKNHMELWEFHFTTSMPPRLIPHACTENVQKICLFNKDGLRLGVRKISCITIVFGGKLQGIAVTISMSKFIFMFFASDLCFLTRFASNVVDQLFSLPGAPLMARMTKYALDVHLGT